MIKITIFGFRYRYWETKNYYFTWKFRSYWMPWTWRVSWERKTFESEYMKAASLAMGREMDRVFIESMLKGVEQPTTNNREI